MEWHGIRILCPFECKVSTLSPRGSTPVPQTLVGQRHFVGVTCGLTGHLGVPSRLPS